MAGVQDSFWRWNRLALIRLAAKLSHVGANLDGLAYRLHWPTSCG
jgi:hypothetical protein